MGFRAIDRLDASPLLIYEVVSALRLHPVAKSTPAQLSAVVEVLNDLQFTREPRNHERATTFVLSRSNPISVYDAVYVAFAVHGRSKVVTADRTLTTQLKSSDTGRRVIMLANLAL